jgi:hypothetical protein
MVAVETQVITERKQVTRQRSGSDALVTVFGTEEQVLHGTLSKVGEDGAQLKLDQRVPPSSLVKIEYADSFLLGEIVYCRPQGQDWIARVKVEHGLFRLSALAADIRENWG